MKTVKETNMNQPQTVREVLDAMDQKFSDESKWSKGAYARNNVGAKVSECSSAATCWCLVGCAISVSPAVDESNQVVGIANEVCRQTLSFLRDHLFDLTGEGASFLHHWNDEPSRTFQQVKDLIQKAKELAT